MEDFGAAEIYIKEIMTIPIELAIKELNEKLFTDRVVPGLKLIVSGGQVIQSYFPTSPVLQTHDYDLKLIAPKTIKYTTATRQRMVLLANGIARYVSIRLNEYISPIFNQVNKELESRYRLKLVQDNGVFKSSTNLRTDLLKTVPFQMMGQTTIRTNSIADIYVVDPSELEHYPTFTGLEGSNKILSKNAGNYYIPYSEINGIPYASLGYIIWDAIRMVKDSKLRGLPKYPRYVAKRDAILNALNNPRQDLSCNAMKEYISSCEKKSSVCEIRGQQFNSVNSLLRLGIEEGMIPPDRETIKKIQETYDFNYLCETMKMLLS